MPFRILAGSVAMAMASFAACAGEREVVAWPGMTVAEFNRLNSTSAKPMRTAGSDWIGVDSPVTLVFRHGQDSVAFVGTRLGGGVQIASSDVALSGKRVEAQVNTIAFNIGGSMEDVAALHSSLVEKCNRLASMAGLPRANVRNAAAIRDDLRADTGTFRDAEICSGEGEQFTFSISATHVDSNAKHGGDFGWAFLNGHLGVRNR